MTFQVMSRNKAREYTYEQHDHDIGIISITDPDKEDVVFNFEPTSGIRSVCRFKFDDEEDGHPRCISEKDAQNIARWLGITDGMYDELIVQCEAGVSRSAGVMAAIQKFMLNDDTAIFNDPKYSPNMTCYRKVLNALVETYGWPHSK